MKDWRLRSAGCVGAVLTLGGALIVTRRAWIGHAALLVGLASVAVATRTRARSSADADERLVIAPSRPSLVGLLLFLLAASTSLLGGHDRAVLALWLTALLLVVGNALVALRRQGAVRLALDGPALALVCGVAAAVDLVRLRDCPPTVHADVGEIALGAAAMDVPRDIFRLTPWWGIPGLHHAIQRAGLFFDPGLFGARLPDAVLGVVAAGAFYLATREVADRRAALVTAIVATGSATLLNTWRSGLGLGPPLVLSIVAFSSFLRAARGGAAMWDLYALAGVAAGLSVQVNLAARVVPLMLVILSLCDLVMRPATARRRVLPGLAWAMLFALAVAAPLLAHIATRHDAMFPLSGKTIFSAGGLRHSREIYGTDSIAGIVATQAFHSVGMFHYFANANRVGFFPSGRPFFEPITAALLLLGVAAALARPSERSTRWTLLAFLSALVVDVTTIDGPSFHRAGPAAAMAVLLAGIGCHRLLDLVEQAIPGRSRRIANALAAVIAVTALAWGARLYFGVQCTGDWGLSDSTAVARRIAAEPADRSFSYLLTAPDFDFHYGNIRFLAAGHEGVDLAPGAPPPRLKPGLNLFIATAARAPELRSLARSLPRGDWEEHRKRGARDELEILVLRIEVPPAREPTVIGPRR